MSGLGNVFDAVAPAADVPRGPDLAVSVEVPRSALGRADGFLVDVPAVLPAEGALVARALDPQAREAGVRLHLARTLPDRATLRLRGQGGVHPQGTPGDLLVTITVREDPPWPSGRVRIAIAVAIAAGASMLAWATLGG
jgi:hypothetical protein